MKALKLLLSVFLVKITLVIATESVKPSTSVQIQENHTDYRLPIKRDIQAYLSDKSVLNTVQKIENKACTNKTVDQIVICNQSGYPIIVHANLFNKTLRLKQERFLITERSRSSEELYWIPITIATKSNPDFSNTSPALWLEGERETVTDAPNITDEWFILNVQHTGFYHVNYDEHSWTLLIEALNSENFGGIPEINRAQIIDDLFNLARADYISYDLALKSTKYLNKEIGHLPWKAFFNAVSFLYDRFDGKNVGEAFKAYVLKLIKPIYEEVGFEGRDNDTQIDKLNRNLILLWVCKLDYPDCVETSKEIFKEWQKDSAKFNLSDAKQIVFCTAIKHAGYNDWKFLWEKYLEARMESEKIIMLNALGCSQNAKIIKKYLNMAISRNSSISKQHVPIVFASVYSSGKRGIGATDTFLRKNYHHFYERIASWDTVAELFANMTQKMSSIDQATLLLLFTDTKNEETVHIRRRLNDLMSLAINNIEWYNNHVTDINRWLKNNERQHTFRDTIQTYIYTDSPVLITLTLSIIIGSPMILIIILYCCLRNHKEMIIIDD